jgi:hypothetical protein
MKLLSIILLLSTSVNGMLVLHCQFTYLSWSIVQADYSCYNPNITQTGDSIALTNVTGNHMANQSNAGVKSLYLHGPSVNVSSDRYINEFPSNISNFFPNLTGLLWSVMNLTTISESDLKPFPKLIALTIYGNKFLSLDANLFQSTPKLVRIDFSLNSIRNVGSDLLSNLDDLVAANFQANSCVGFNANNRQQVEELKVLLRDQCPSLETTTLVSTTTADSCSARCSINEEVDELKRENVRINEELVELRRLIRELQANPW